MSEPAGRYQRSAAGMIGAMLVLLAVIAAFVAFRALNRNNPDSPVQPVDYQQTLDYARGQVDFPLLAPESLPKGWRATSVDFVPEPPRWHLGVLTGQNRYVGLEQSRTSVHDMVDKYVDPDAAPGRPVQVRGESWRSWTDPGGDTALTLEQNGVTTLVVSTTGQDVLVGYVESLR